MQSPPGRTWKLFSSYIFFHFFYSKTITNWVNKKEKYNGWRKRWAAEQISKPLVSRWPCSLLPLCAPHSFDSSTDRIFHLHPGYLWAGSTWIWPVVRQESQSSCRTDWGNVTMRQRKGTQDLHFFFSMTPRFLFSHYTELYCLHSQLRDMLNTHFPANLEDWRRNGKISLRFSVSCKCFRWLNKWVLISIFLYSTMLFIF